GPCARLVLAALVPRQLTVTAATIPRLFRKEAPMNDLWKIWQQITPREGVIGLAVLMLASFAIHMMVMLASDRYSAGLLG
ncbi:MAG: hypothetical protein AAFN17_07765, partial [Pseudomonadota bacterium]